MGRFPPISTVVEEKGALSADKLDYRTWAIRMPSGAIEVVFKACISPDGFKWRTAFIKNQDTITFPKVYIRYGTPLHTVIRKHSPCCIYRIGHGRSLLRHYSCPKEHIFSDWKGLKGPFLVTDGATFSKNGQPICGAVPYVPRGYLPGKPKPKGRTNYTFKDFVKATPLMVAGAKVTSRVDVEEMLQIDMYMTSFNFIRGRGFSRRDPIYKLVKNLHPYIQIAYPNITKRNLREIIVYYREHYWCKDCTNIISRYLYEKSSN